MGKEQREQRGQSHDGPRLQLIMCMFVASIPMCNARAIKVPHNTCTHSKGDLGELSDHGSLHQYLVYLHDHGRCPVTSFWWAKTHVVSVCSPKAFEDTQKLYNRPGM